MKPLAGLKRLGAGILPTAVFALVALALIALMPSAGLCADTTGPGVKLSWSAPGDVAASKVTGYNIYRSDKIMGHYELINKEPLKVLVYEDRGLPKGKEYFYKVCTVFTDGRESEPSTPVGNVSGAADGSPEIDLPRIEFFTSAALDKITYAGEEAVFILNGNASMTATMDIPGVVSDIPMTESKPGTYKAVYVVKSGDNYKNIPAVATLKDKRGGVSIKETPATLSFSGSPKPSLAGLYAGIVESDRVGLNWPRAELGLDGYYSIYRDISRIISIQGMRPLSTNIGPERSAYIDRDVMPGTTYYYVLAVNQPDGSISAQTENLKVVLPDAGHISGIDVAEDSAGRQMKPGDTITVTATMKTGGKAFYAIGTAVRQLALSEVTPGVYKASYTFREGDGVFKTRVAVSYKDASGVASFANSATFVDVNAPRAAIVAKTGPKPVISEITDDIQSVVGRSGRLVAGKTFHVSMKGDPGNRASFSIGEGIWRIAMKETTPGEYSGEYTVKPGDWAGSDPDPLKREFVVGLLESPSGAVSDPVSGSVPVVVDTTCTIDVALDSSSLPADGRSRTRVVFTATDADGEPVADRRISVLLEPPAGYTGVAGGGGMDMTTDAEKAAGTLGRLELDFDDMTDSMGRVAATYTAGLAAKTAMLVGRDFMTGSLGIGYVTTTITSSVSIKLTEPFGADKVTAPNAPIYQLVVDFVPDPLNPVRNYPDFLIDAVPNLLTADGVSRANIIATLTLNGLPVQGKTIVFAVSGAGGTLTASSAVTDASGRAQVFYIAGKKAGRALITATEPDSGTSVTTVVTLLADAPARIYAKSYPDSIPADGGSSSMIMIELADANDNPTEGVIVNMSLRDASGAISLNTGVTDIRGAIQMYYTAGTKPGTATIDISATSPVPTADELKNAHNQITAPLIYDNNDFSELRLVKWYRQPGDRVGRGQPVAVIEGALGQMTVYAPADGVLAVPTVPEGFNVMEGKEIGALK